MKSTENRADHKEQRISELEDRNTEMIPVENGKNKIFSKGGHSARII